MNLMPIAKAAYCQRRTEQAPVKAEWMQQESEILAAKISTLFGGESVPTPPSASYVIASRTNPGESVVLVLEPPGNYASELAISYTCMHCDRPLLRRVTTLAEIGEAVDKQMDIHDDCPSRVHKTS